MCPQSAVTKIREQPIVTNLVPLNASESEAILSKQPDARGEQSNEASGPTGNAGQQGGIVGEMGAVAQEQPSPPPPGEWTRSRECMLLAGPWRLQSGPLVMLLNCPGTVLTGLKRFLPVDDAAAGGTGGSMESLATDRPAVGDLSNEASKEDAALYLATLGEGFHASLAEV